MYLLAVPHHWYSFFLVGFGWLEKETNKTFKIETKINAMHLALSPCYARQQERLSHGRISHHVVLFGRSVDLQCQSSA